MNQSQDNSKLENTVKLTSEGFDFSRFAVDQSTMPVPFKKHLLTVHVGKPNKQKFFRRKIGPGYEPKRAYTLEIKEGIERDIYLIDPRVMSEIPIQEMQLVDFFLCYYSDGIIFILEIPVPDSTRKPLDWHTSLRQGMVFAEKSWIRCQANMGNGAYDIVEALNNYAEPPIEWKTFNEYLGIAFKDSIIDNKDHTVLKKLRGEI